MIEAEGGWSLAPEGAAVHVPERTAVIADVHLGASDSGYDVARRARRLNPRIEVIYITGRSLDVERFGVSGGVLLPKPFDIDNLIDVVLALAMDPA